MGLAQVDATMATMPADAREAYLAIARGVVPTRLIRYEVGPRLRDWLTADGVANR